MSRTSPIASEPTPRTESPAATTDGAAGSAGRRPYHPPRVIARDSLEVMAASCTPSPPGKVAGFCSLSSS